MKIAAVTPACNDWANLESFRRFRDEYKDQLTWHIIVDNASSEAYQERLQTLFPDCLHVRREANGGTTGAFNSGILQALELGAEAVLLLSQDLRLDRDCIPELERLLISDSTIGVVTGLLLEGGGSDRIQEFGGSLDRRLNCRKYFSGARMGDPIPETIEVDFLTGGLNLARAEAYRTTGLQNERLFMYWDEVDWDMRAKKAGWKLMATRRARAWHEHLPMGRSPATAFFLFRNRILIGFWHLTRVEATLRFGRASIQALRELFGFSAEGGYRFLGFLDAASGSRLRIDRFAKKKIEEFNSRRTPSGEAAGG